MVQVVAWPSDSSPLVPFLLLHRPLSPLSRVSADVAVHLTFVATIVQVWRSGWGWETWVRCGVCSTRDMPGGRCVTSIIFVGVPIAHARRLGIVPFLGGRQFAIDTMGVQLRTGLRWRLRGVTRDHHVTSVEDALCGQGIEARGF